MVCFERDYTGGFPNLLICRSEIQICTWCKQRNQFIDLHLAGRSLCEWTNMWSELTKCVTMRSFLFIIFKTSVSNDSKLYIVCWNLTIYHLAWQQASCVDKSEDYKTRFLLVWIDVIRTSSFMFKNGFTITPDIIWRDFWARWQLAEKNCQF